MRTDPQSPIACAARKQHTLPKQKRRPTGRRFRLSHSSDLDKLIRSGADADLLGVLQTAHPIRLRMDAMEVVVVMDVTAVGRRTPHHRLSVDGIHTGHIQCHRVEGGEHSHIGNMAASFSA